MYNTATEMATVIHMQGCCDDDGMWMSQADAEYQEHLDDVEDYKDSFWGSISPGTAAKAVHDLLNRSMPHMLMEKFGQNYKNNFEGFQNTAKTIKFRRYNGVFIHEAEKEIPGKNPHS